MSVADATVLDDISHIRAVDKSEMIGIVEASPDQFRRALRSLPFATGKRNRVVRNILFLGLGGSAIAGDIIQDASRDFLDLPVIVWREPKPPAFAGKDTLAVVISYSGETRETISAMKLLKKRGCRLIAVSSGGSLERTAGKFGITHIKTEGGLQPRAALPSILVAAVAALNAQIPMQRFWRNLKRLPDVLEVDRKSLCMESKSGNNEAKALSLELLGKIPVVFAPSRFQSVARRFKNQLNENSKIESRFELTPELYHNEVESWRNGAHPNHKLIIIRDNDETHHEKRLIQSFTEILNNSSGISAYLHITKGSTPLEKIIRSIYFFDLVSCYLAVLRGLDPTPVSQILKLKQAGHAMD